MWKFVTRGIRESLERRASCRTNVYSQTTTDNGCNQNEVRTNFAKEQKFLSPNVVASCHSGFFGSAKSGGPKDKKNDSKWDTGRSWSEAVGWSSVLAVGWVVCQSLCLRRRLFERSKEDKWHNRILRFHSIPLSFVDTFDIQPRHVFPVTNCIAEHKINDTDDNLKQEWIASRPYGPITIEEALKEAKDDYTKTHRLVMGEFELHFGIKALEEKRYKDAVNHFSTGARLSSSGSMFNLGLCHELGIGTVRDTIKAAKYYRNAADKGHPDAMYNLGVFHAQGRGGLSLNMDKARELFIEAASLGQQEAKKALELEKNFATSSRKDSTCEIRQRNLTCQEKEEEEEGEMEEEKVNETKPLKLSGYNNSESSVELHSKCSSKISYCDQSIASIESSTDIFLNSLGIQTNSQRLLVNTSDCTVPCCT